MRWPSLLLIVVIVGVMLVSTSAPPIGPSIAPATASPAPAAVAPAPTVAQSRSIRATPLDDRGKDAVLGLMFLLSAQQARHGR
jgi:hypothetical protein